MAISFRSKFPLALGGVTNVPTERYIVLQTMSLLFNMSMRMIVVEIALTILCMVFRLGKNVRLIFVTQ